MRILGKGEVLLLFAKFQTKLESGKVDAEALSILDQIISEIKNSMDESERAVKQAEKSSKVDYFAIYHGYRNVWLILRKMRERFENENGE